MAALLRDVLSQEKFKILMFHQQVYLKQLVRDEKQSLQQERDSVKNSVLQKAGIPLKRIRTTDGDVEERLEKFLLSYMCAE